VRAVLTAGDHRDRRVWDLAPDPIELAWLGARIVRAVDEERWHAELAEPAIEEVVVGGGRC